MYVTLYINLPIQIEILGETSLKKKIEVMDVSFSSYLEKTELLCKV